MSNKLIKEFNANASWLRNGVMYHRGKHNSVVKENTLLAFQGAVDDRLNVEFDVRLTKDEKVVISHDDNLKRVFGGDALISEHTYEEVKQLSNGGVPLLEELLKLVDGKIGLMVEIKSTKVGRLEELVYNILKDYKGKYTVVSFNPFSLSVIIAKSRCSTDTYSSFILLEAFSASTRILSVAAETNTLSASRPPPETAGIFESSSSACLLNRSTSAPHFFKILYASPFLSSVKAIKRCSGQIC